MESIIPANTKAGTSEKIQNLQKQPMSRIGSSIVAWVKTHRIFSTVIGAGIVTLAVFGSIHSLGLYHYYQAKAAIDRRHTEMARSHLEFCLRVWPYSAEIYFLAGRNERLDDKLDRAQELLHRAGRLQGDVDKRLQLEFTLLRGQQGGFREVEPGLVRWVNANKGHADVPFVLGVLARGYMEQQRMTSARDVLDQWLRIDPNNPRALEWRGYVLEKLLFEDDAIADYRRAVELAPHNNNTRMRYAKYLLYRNNLTEARRQIKLLLEKTPDDPNVLFIHARCLFLQSKTQEARTLLEKLVTNEPKNSEFLHALARLELQEGNFRKAEELARQTIAVKYTKSEAHHLRAEALSALGRDKEADEQQRIYKQVDKDVQRVHKLFTIEDHNSGNAATYLELGQLFRRLKSPKAGESWLLRALQVDNTLWAAHQQLAELYREQNQPERAANHQRLADKYR